jgi:hypothetical protein
MKFPLILRTLAAVFLASSLYAQTPAEQIRHEVSRLQKQATAAPDSDTKTSLLKTVKRAEMANSRNQDFLALEELATAHLLAQVLKDEQLQLDKATGMPKFEAEFKRAQPELAAADRRARARTWRDVPAAIRAIAEISQAKTLVLMEATRPYAMADGPQSGMLYIGQARATVQTSDFAASLHAASRRVPKLRSVLPELHALQTRVNATFNPPRSIERHSDYIRLNSTLKMAFELDAARLYAGAIYRYLEATRQFELMDAPAPNDARKAAFARTVAAFTQRIRDANRDDSLALLFLQKAQAFAAGREGDSPSPDDWKNAFVIVEKVLPAYFTAQTSTPAMLAAKGKTITVTLVRWPYT